MPVVRSLPAGEGRNRLLRLYHDLLRAHWSWAERGLARVFDKAGMGAGWTRIELALLPAEVRAAGVSQAERKGIHRLINPAGYPQSRNLLRDKARFARHARDHGLPQPVTFNPDSERLDRWLEGREAIIAKPGFSSKGCGIVVYRRSAGSWTGPEGAIGESLLRQRLRSVLARHGVVQELVATHRDLADISPAALPTMRIVTCRNETGALEACVAILKLAGGRRPVDNFNAEGIGVRIDPAGTCIIGFQAGADPAGIADHPMTGKRITGRGVPDFGDAVALALRAHESMPDGFALVGWDIGMTARGPVIVEGNWNPGTQVIQVVEGKGIDDLRIGELYRFHVERLSEADWRSARALEW